MIRSPASRKDQQALFENCSSSIEVGRISCLYAEASTKYVLYQIQFWISKPAIKLQRRQKYLIVDCGLSRQEILQSGGEIRAKALRHGQGAVLLILQDCL